MNFDWLDNLKIEYKLNEPMKNHTSFKIGGSADVFLTADSVDTLQSVLAGARKHGISCFVIGKGSNLLVSDDGIEGIVISLAGMSDISVSGNRITCSAGVSLAALCRAALEASLSGLEFAYGIPGSVGGALYMNAGAYGGEMSRAVKSAHYIDGDGVIREISVSDMQLGYRTSVFKTGKGIITDAVFELVADDASLIESRMNELMERRRQKQPLEYPSAGSTFKRPEGFFAGTLIEKNGLKGASVGGAKVSEKHAGFVINYRNASCKDVTELIEKIQETVLAADGIGLEPEVLCIGRGVKK